ncbi:MULTISPECIES: GTP-binding protein [unclassified Crossiella]|uniref:CobW family GTP-binding protein n=1 Tax=unclassified Crossiella TaxID=2620835 RepID=UPI001FFFAC73|nr:MULTISPECIES: GTP-binding protein [unclassified Crossiella]MCK2236597.1 GTP-binding protein [Crossiella sp. S99.2]MCK2250264.1 GTP-binding protein [Crossiella sp. S99.1]
MSKQQIPVIVVAGFLGSGKTTLLNHLLHNNNGARIGVVVNDFGQVNIDAMLVAGQADSMVSLSNGCLCCVADTSELDELLDRLARPQARIDVIVIEASGLAEPQTLVRMVVTSENPRLGYGGLVEVVDAVEFEATRERHPELAKHLRLADLVVLNKVDRIDDTERLLLLNELEHLAPGTPILPTSHGRIDTALLFDHEPRAEDLSQPRQLTLDELLREHDEDHSHEHLHTAYDSVSFTESAPLHPGRLMDFLRDRPTGVYRIKGFVHFGLPEHDQRFTLHTVGSHLQVSRSPWPRGENRLNQLVLIGAEVDAEEIRRRLADCVDPDPASTEERSMLRLLAALDEPQPEN